MSNVETGGMVKAPEPMYEPPIQPSVRLTYYRDICHRMTASGKYVAIAGKITSAEGKLTDYETAIAAALSGTDGKVTARNVAELNADIEMDYMLSDIYKVGNSDPVNAVAHYQDIGVSWKSRQSHERPEIEIRHGKDSGSFVLMVRPLDVRFAAIWFYTTDPNWAPENWKFADFSHNSTGFIDGLTKGTTYFFKAMTSSPAGKSAWTQVIEITCL